MPEPNPGEEHDDFIDRCMEDDEAQRDFPDPEERRAFCESQWDENEEGSMSRAFEVALDTPWAITEDYLRVILEVASREIDAELAVEAPDLPEPSCVGAELGRPLDGTRNVRVRDGVAIVPVVGPIFRRANLLTEISGATSTEVLARDFAAAVEAPSVEALVLEMDSPGGEVNGLSELSDMVFEARGEKPIVAFVSGAGASGGYWVASAADRVIAADTAMLGSIGVRVAFLDTRERDRQEGVRTIEIVSSQSPKKAPDPAEEDGRAQIQRTVNDIADVFIDAVARNRGVSRETVLNDFGQGDVLVGDRAVQAGLADAVGTFEGVLEDLQARSDQNAGDMKMSARTKGEDGGDMSDQETTPTVDELEDPTAEELREAFPEVIQEIEAARDERERDRMQAIYEIEAPGHEDLIAEKMFDPEATRESVSEEIVRRQAEARKERLEARRRDEEELEAPAPRAGAEELEGADEAAAQILGAARKAGVIPA